MKPILGHGSAQHVRSGTERCGSSLRFGEGGNQSVWVAIEVCRSFEHNPALMPVHDRRPGTAHNLEVERTHCF
jgi:hypothetical protein